jgi:hypothetical protein
MNVSRRDEISRVKRPGRYQLGSHPDNLLGFFMGRFIGF